MLTCTAALGAEGGPDIAGYTWADTSSGGPALNYEFGEPSIVSFTNPAAAAQAEIENPRACVSKRSMVEMGDFDLYATADGLVAVDGSGNAPLITASVIDRYEWKRLNPERSGSPNGRALSVVRPSAAEFEIAPSRPLAFEHREVHAPRHAVDAVEIQGHVGDSAASEQLGIALHDHVIIGKNSHVSFKALGLL